MKTRRWFSHFLFSIFYFLLPVICVHLWFPLLVLAQEGDPEIVANLSTGRALFCVTKDGIVLATVHTAASPADPDARPPAVVELPGGRIAILLGAVEWVLPGSGKDPVRLDLELPRLLAGSAAEPPKTADMDTATDIEAIGIRLLERLRGVATNLHSKIDMRPDEPLLELILVGHVPNYGPEVWRLSYRIAQDLLRGDFWRTRVLRPHIVQLYPPEKGQPRTLIEVAYPPDAPGPALAELLTSDDPRLARIRSGDPAMARAIEKIATGESHKTDTAPATAFLRAALSAVVPQETGLVFGVLSERRSVDWALAPPEPAQKVEQPSEPGAPTLRKKRP